MRLTQHIVPGRYLATSDKMPARFNFSFYSTDSEWSQEGIDAGVAVQPAHLHYCGEDFDGLPQNVYELIDSVYGNEDLVPAIVEDTVFEVLSQNAAEVVTTENFLQYFITALEEEELETRQAWKKAMLHGFLRKFHTFLGNLAQAA